MKAKIKTIDIQAKEWFDKSAGNSYFAGSVTTDFGTPTEKTWFMPFQYGYGDSYIYTALKLLNEAKITPVSSTREAREQGIILRYKIQTGCKKKDVQYIGYLAELK